MMDIKMEPLSRPMKYYFFVDGSLWAVCDTEKKRIEIENYLNKSLDKACQVYVIGFGEYMQTYRVERG